MSNFCDVCLQEVWGFSILGIMPGDRIERRKPAHVCMKCMDTCPCTTKGSWWNGLLTCPHGYVYDIDYQWNGTKAELIFNLQKRKWWSYFVISKAKHQKIYH